MTTTSGALIITAAVLLGGAVSVPAQQPLIPDHPSFTGTWAPAEPAKSDRLFEVGLSPIPGRARLILEQRRTNRLRVTIQIPDDVLDAFDPRFFAYVYTTITYNLFEPGRSGGAGAAGEPQPTLPTWVGDQIVIPNPRPSSRPLTMTLAMEKDRLKLDTRIEIDAKRTNTVTEWFTRVKPDRPE